MDELSRRTFGALVAASTGTLTGRLSMNEHSTRHVPEPTGDANVVTTEAGLEAAFDDLSPGDTVHITAEGAPYRTTRWLDVDEDDVTVTGPGVERLIHPEEGANVGGFRIGHNERCRGIEIRGIGFNGTPVPRGEDADRLHGIAVRNARGVTLERNRIRETYPRSHGDGGSGISVTHRCSDVRIVDNHVHAFGDRGVQLGGKRIQVFGNEIAYGLDRPVSCDLWYPSRRNHTAESVAIFGNMLGNSVEGSLVGVARNWPLGSDHGYVTVFGNVGYGSHKSFVHLRGPATVANVSVQNNVSRQTTDMLRTERTTQFAGVTIDADAGRNLTVRNNELHDYSGHGILVDSDVTGLGIQNNTISEASLGGIHVTGNAEGTIDGNRIREPAGAGIRLVNTADLAVRGNYVGRAGTYGIVTTGSSDTGSVAITSNYVTANNQRIDRSVPAVFVRNAGTVVRGNTVHQASAPAIGEADDADANLFDGNWADKDRAWRIRSPRSIVRNHTPPVGVHRDLTTGDDGTVHVEFDRPYARAPKLSYGRTGGGVRETEFVTDDDGNFVGVHVATGRVGRTLDVFVDDC